ncbi:MAG: hypothetical protein WBG70_11240 [Spirulinaceae cyanobacterium]
MTGFIKGLFSKKPPLPGEEGETKQTTPKAKNAKKQKQNSQAYFLNDDDAKTLGNIDYMRTASTVRRTFPKTLGSEKGAEFIQQVSSLEKTTSNGSSNSQPKTTPETKKFIAKDDSSSKRRRTDTSMDLFRNMARDLKK